MIERDGKSGLFPAIWSAPGWEISAQGDKQGYACKPRYRHDFLEEYESVELVIRSPWGGLASQCLGDLARHFAFLDGTTKASLFPVNHLDELIDRVSSGVEMSPNFGCPRGNVLWPGAALWMEMGERAANSIIADGFCVRDYEPGEVGPALYFDRVRPESGGIGYLSAVIAPGANILDLRNEADAKRWADGHFHNMLNRTNLARVMLENDIDGVNTGFSGQIGVYNMDILTDLHWIPGAPAGRSTPRKTAR